MLQVGPILVSFIGVILPILIAWLHDRHPEAQIRRKLELAKLRVEFLDAMLRTSRGCNTGIEGTDLDKFVLGELKAMQPIAATPPEVARSRSMPIWRALTLLHKPHGVVEWSLRIFFYVTGAFGAMVIIFGMPSDQGDDLATKIAVCVVLLSPAVSAYAVMVYRSFHAKPATSAALIQQYADE